jgi:hypothetical protein
MLTENRKYHFVGELTLSRSHVLDKQCQPKDDKVNWLFLNSGEHQFSFVYKMENPLEAKYGSPFNAELSFTVIETVINVVELNHSYEVLRGQEIIGRVSLIRSIYF